MNNPNVILALTSDALALVAFGNMLYRAHLCGTWSVVANAIAAPAFGAMAIALIVIGAPL